ncbi:MAG: hypothetical protein NTW87_27540 [Planctomycetota bacterium]|nr:hypothetical protein [Planctomycetota bacterium]
MKAEPRFLNQPKHFWANVRLISAKVGYTIKRRGQILVPSLDQMLAALKARDLTSDHIMDARRNPTALGTSLCAYFQYRADVLNGFVEAQLMDAPAAKQLYAELCATCKPRFPVPMNKQKGRKRKPAYFTGMVNLLIEAHTRGWPCDFNPRSLTSVTRGGAPLRTLARWVDGAFPSPVNPIAVWEIKEYYYTTTFGSRVADGVYETLLDGMEIEELREHERYDIKHYLFVDSHYTWWECGRSYLCRIVDMLHMGCIDEVLFGREVVDRLPALAKEWLAIAAKR